MDGMPLRSRKCDLGVASFLFAQSWQKETSPLNFRGKEHYKSGRLSKEFGSAGDCSPSESEPSLLLGLSQEDMLQPVKGIELREEDRGEMVPNMGIKSVPVLSPTAHTNAPHVQAAPPLNQRGFVSTLDVIGQQSEHFWPKKFFHSAREWMLSKRWVSRQRMLRRLTPFRRRYWEEGFKNSLILDVSVLLIHGGGKQ